MNCSPKRIEKGWLLLCSMPVISGLLDGQPTLVAWYWAAAWGLGTSGLVAIDPAFSRELN